MIAPRAVAQLGSALDWGSRGRGFESRQPDKKTPARQGFSFAPDRCQDITGAYWASIFLDASARRLMAPDCIPGKTD